MWRNVGVMLFIFALPVMQVILFCLAIGGDPIGLKVAIVNQEVPYHNQTYLDCPFEIGCKFSNLSCRYLDTLNTTTITKVIFYFYLGFTRFELFLVNWSDLSFNNFEKHKLS